MIVLKTLEDIDTGMLHETFVSVFSDYQIKIDLPFWKFQQMLQRRGFVPDISMGAFNDGVLVGFVLNGLRSWNGKATAYDVGTGVIGEYRKQGITSNIFASVKELLCERKVEQYLLEVLKPNTAAIQLYRKQGFEVVRDFACFRIDKSRYDPLAFHEVEWVDRIDPEEWGLFPRFWDFLPSWQNSIDSIKAVPDTFTCCIVRKDNDITGYGIIDRRTGDIPQIAVDKEYRHKGIARSIMTGLLARTESDRAGVLNVEEQADAMKAFLADAGFEYSVGQHEMLLVL